jgi:hypothetical protein
MCNTIGLVLASLIGMQLFIMRMRMRIPCPLRNGACGRIDAAVSLPPYLKVVQQRSTCLAPSRQISSHRPRTKERTQSLEFAGRPRARTLISSTQETPSTSARSRSKCIFTVVTVVNKPQWYTQSPEFAEADFPSSRPPPILLCPSF